jgi:RNA polymerase sigma-70 factor (ECF subfamily)
VDVAAMLEEKLLIWRFNRGDTAALCRIYEKYRDGLLKVAAALLNDESGIEDVLHDVFVDFAQSTGRFQLRGSLKGYLAICVANRARDRNRRMQRRAGASLDEASTQQVNAAAPDHAAAQDELVATVGEAMTELPDEQRETIVLHLQSRLRFREIARLQGVSVNTALSRYRYGLNKLRSSLNGELEP